MLFTLLGQWNTLNMPLLYTVEQGMNRERSGVCVIFDFFSNF